MAAIGNVVGRHGLPPLLMLAMVVSGAAAEDGVFYKWTDDRGVVHYADQPPAEAGDAERRVLAVPPAEVRPATPPGAEEAARAAPETESARAEVVVVSSQTPRIGPSVLELAGEVKNTGARSARGVVVRVDVLDDTQHNPCTSLEVAVEPSALEPEQTGKFETEVDHPCLFGDPVVRFEPRWD